jgi:hypothetical protein
VTLLSSIDLIAQSGTTTSVADFLKLETAFTILQFAIVAPLIALVYRGVPASSPR